MNIDRSFWCLRCPTRVHVETPKPSKRYDMAEIMNTCPACGEAMWDLETLIKDGYTAYDGTDYFAPDGTKVDDAKEHARLNEMSADQDLLSEEDSAKREIAQAEKKLAKIAEKRKAR